MPLTTPMRPYTREGILPINPNQHGVYVIFRGDDAVYVGSGDIREQMLAHVEGDNPCIGRNAPDEWTAAVVPGDTTSLEEQLIREYRPTCNLVTDR